MRAVREQPRDQLDPVITDVGDDSESIGGDPDSERWPITGSLLRVLAVNDRDAAGATGASIMRATSALALIRLRERYLDLLDLQVARLADARSDAGFVAAIEDLRTRARAVW